ncbi:extracellular solute-binding protein [Cellulomonas sp. IC4_254]|uniref:extracellular solute-binding protein n=1 Tax=Cellulomonas sp. IC4_254 TaxID=2714040 RepID=UPI00141F3074|nr:extracellular solute-binding protein [Cellulomonas sp. IC4_254]NHT17718.1 extracellular solute-binding protein [Cellulomonas sp. IC4_254]
MRSIRTAALLGAVALATTACSGGSDGDDGGSGDTAATGPITVWLSNNEQEVGWGQDVVDAWNADHPDEQVTAQEIPAGSSSEEAITAAITAGTAPCLVYNISSAAVPGWVRQGGLVDLATFDDGADYISARGGDGVSAYETDGGSYQLPWKSNPVMVMYNKALFAQAGLDPEDPGMATFDDFLAGAQQIVDSGAAPSAIWPSPTNDFYQPWFDFYPVYLAETDGTALVEDGKATFDDESGKAVADFWASIYADGLAPQEAATDDAMVSGQTAMQLAGPWAIASYKDSVDVGFMPVPTSDGREDVTTFADSKNVSMFTSCENQGTAWEFLKYSTSEENDGALLEASGQMPLRQDLAATYPDYFAAHPEYEVFADQAARTGDVPSIPNSIEAWQAFREAYTSAVIFRSTSVEDFLSSAAAKIDDLVQG